MTTASTRSGHAGLGQRIWVGSMMAAIVNSRTKINELIAMIAVDSFLLFYQFCELAASVERRRAEDWNDFCKCGKFKSRKQFCFVFSYRNKNQSDHSVFTYLNQITAFPKSACRSVRFWYCFDASSVFFVIIKFNGTDSIDIYWPAHNTIKCLLSSNF